MVTSDSTVVAEAVACSGIDWIFFDLEHSANSLETVQKQIQAVAGRVFTAIRIEAPEAVYVKRGLDTGCDAVIIPQVNSAEVAMTAVDAGKFPPMGNRGVGFTRAHQYGARLSESIANANTGTAIIAQIEHMQAVQAIEEIASVPGIGALFIGPYDLSCSMRLVGQVDHPDVQKAMERVKSVARRAKLPVGTFAGTDANAIELAHEFQMLLVGTDIGRLVQSLESTVSTVRKGNRP